MEKKKLLLLSCILLSSCSSYKTNNITYDEYLSVVKNMESNDKCIVFLSQDGCSNCKLVKPLLNKYIKNDIEDNVPIYRIDLTISNGNYKDNTLGAYKDINNDNLKKLDNRINAYQVECNIPTSILLDMYSPSTYFSYICTPMFIFYEGGKEVYINSNIDSIVKENGKIDYNDFKEFIKFKDTYKYSKDFDL